MCSWWHNDASGADGQKESDRLVAKPKKLLLIDRQREQPTPPTQIAYPPPTPILPLPFLLVEASGIFRR